MHLIKTVKSIQHRQTKLREKNWDVEYKIPDISGLATTAVLNTNTRGLTTTAVLNIKFGELENKIRDVSGSVKKNSLWP